MSQIVEEALVPVQAELLKQEQEAQLAAAVNPATVAAFVQIGVQLLHFAATLFGGKVGAALNQIAGVINGLNNQLQDIANQTQKILAGVEETINSFDRSELSKLYPVHSQVMGYLGSFPSGAPKLADTNNVNYGFANQNTGAAIAYFQSNPRGPMAFMPSLCHATNSRMELAVSTWSCWWVQNDPAQPFFNQELNVSSGKLSSNMAWARPHIGKGIYVKAVYPPHVTTPTPTVGPIGDDPPLPPEVEAIGYQVREGSTVLWEKMDENAYGEALAMKESFRRQRQNETLAGYMGTLDRWVNMSARMAPAGIARALDLGDAQTFLRYVNPSALVMEEPAENVSALGLEGKGTVYRTLPMRDILLDILTSDAIRARHGLLVKGADKRSVSTWFEKTFFRQPSPTELDALLKVVEIFGHDAFFGCLAYSNEYKNRFGEGIPAPVSRPTSAPAPTPAPGPITKA
jgi:hypothetical protein